MSAKAVKPLQLGGWAAGRLGGSQLLEAAKRAIEIAIEDSEAAALAYLSQVAPPELAPIDY